MQEIEDRETQTQSKKWTSKEEQLLKKMVKEGATVQEI